MLALIAGLCLLVAAVVAGLHRAARREQEHAAELRRQLSRDLGIVEREDGRGWH